MGNKLKFLIGQSFHKKIDSKQFIIVNIIIALLVIGLTNIDSIIKAFGGDFNEAQQIYVVDNTNELYDDFSSSLTAISSNTTKGSESLKYKVDKYTGSIDDAKAYVQKNNKTWVIIFDKDSTNYVKATIVSEAYIDTINYQVLSSVINSIKGKYAIKVSGIDTNF